MDLITQTQNYVHTLSSLLAHATEHIHQHAPPLPTSAAAVSLPDGVPLAPTPEFPLEPIEEKSKMIFKRIADGMLTLIRPWSLTLTPCCSGCAHGFVTREGTWSRRTARNYCSARTGIVELITRLDEC